MRWIRRGCLVILSIMVGLVVMSLALEIIGGLIRLSSPLVPRSVARLTNRDPLPQVQVSVHDPWEIHWQAQDGDLRILASSFGWKEPTVEEIKPFDNLHPEDIEAHENDLPAPTMTGVVRTADPHVIRIEHGGSFLIQVIPEFGDDGWSIEVIQLP